MLTQKKALAKASAFLTKVLFRANVLTSLRLAVIIYLAWATNERKA